MSDGSVVPLPSPTVSQQRILATLNIVQTVSCILFPVGGLIVSVFLFYYLKLKQPISCLQNGIMRIQNNDLDFSLPILSNDEMGQLCAAFEEMRSELLKSNRLLWQQAEERKRLNAAFSHDLRNPITVLKGSVKLLRQGIQDEQTICSVCRSTDPWLSGMEKCQRSPIHRCRRFHGAGNPASLLLKDLPFLPAPAVHAAFVQHYCCQTYQIPLRDLRGKITALAIGATFRGRSEDTACLFIFQSVECAGLTRRPFCFLFCFTFMYMTCLSQF